MTGFSITILFGGLVSTLRELMSPYKLNKIFIGGLVTGWGGGSYVDIYRDLVSRGSCDALPFYHVPINLIATRDLLHYFLFF
jgi:hypothetical protein